MLGANTCTNTSYQYFSPYCADCQYLQKLCEGLWFKGGTMHYKQFELTDHLNVDTTII